MSKNFIFLSPVYLSLSIFYLAATPSWAQGLTTAQADSKKVVGDRLLVSINSTPYTQRQMEVYLAVKEGLREATKEAAPVLSAANWSAALAAFSEDMIIHQEAHRVGSFQVSESAEKIARGKFESRRNADAGIAASVRRLGIDERSLTRTLHTVLRTEAFRRNKERQSVVARADDDGAPRWFEEIKDRAVVRFFAEAETYIEITPALAR